MLPSAAITLVGVLGVGPAAPKGALAGQFDLVGDLVWASPTVLWAVGWLFAWSGERDVLETRVTFGLVAGFFSLTLCALLWMNLALVGLGQALN